MKHFIFLFLLLAFLKSESQRKVIYPYPIQKISVPVDNIFAQMAFMDVPPFDKSNGKTVLLLHGKNFTGYYWKDVIDTLSKRGYRVIAPDQVGWGHSDKPAIYYNFHLLARNTSLLLDSINIKKVILIGHSMGGMLASRFAMLYPEKVEKLILEDPIGLEDYKRFVPYRTITELTTSELKATYESYKKYQQSYYPEWKPEYEQYVEVQAEALNEPDFPAIAEVNALTYQMIYEQPVCYEWDRITVPTLLIVGGQDRTIVGKSQLSGSQKNIHGQYPALGKKTSQQIKDSKLAILPGIGHIPHIQNIKLFCQYLFDFIK